MRTVLAKLPPRVWVSPALAKFVFLAALWSVTLCAGAQPEAATNAVAAQAPATLEAGASRQADKVWLTFGLNHVPGLDYRPIANIPLWQYVASLVYIFLAFYLSKLLDYLIKERVQKWTARTNTRIDDLLIGLVRGPVKVVTFVVLLHIGMEVYSWPDSMTRFFSSALSIIVACSITYVLLKATDVLIGAWRERTTTPENEQFSKQLLPLISKSLKVFLVIVAILVTSQNLGLNVTGLIASLSIGGLALGLAAQDTLANLFGAVAVLIDRPFKVGDRIKLDTVDGVVESIGFRSTRVRNLDGHLVTVPNKTMGNATITNVSLRPNIKTTMNLGLTYDTSPEKVQLAKAIVEKIFRADPMTEDVWITFDKFGDFALNLQIVHWWKGSDYKAFLAKLHEVNLEVKQQFGSQGIEFAFPTQTLYVKTDGETSHGNQTPVAAAPLARQDARAGI